MRSPRILCFLAGVFLLIPVPGFSASGLDSLPAAKPDPKRIQELRRHFGLDRYSVKNQMATLRIAILDDGYGGYSNADVYGVLPSENKPVLVELYSDEFFERNKKYFEGLGISSEYWKSSYKYGARKINAQNRHGLYLAQSIWQLTGGEPSGPQFYLLNANGVTNFLSAVAYAVEARVDLILFAQQHIGYGNGRGDGLIDRAVSYATQNGIIWVNSAGNFGGHSYTGPIEVDPDGNLKFSNGKTYLEFETTLTEQKVNIQAIWTDRWDRLDDTAEKDLDVSVYRVETRGTRGDEELISGDQGRTRQGPLVEVSKADLGDSKKGPANKYAIEEIALKIPEKGRYRIRVKAITPKAAFHGTDQIRLLVQGDRPAGDGLVFLDAVRQREIYPPADHPDVITVGVTEKFSSQGPTLDLRPRRKPDVLMDQFLAAFDNGMASMGTSEGAAYLSAVLLVMKAYSPTLSTQKIFRLIETKAKENILVQDCPPNSSPSAQASDSSPPLLPGVQVVNTPRGPMIVVRPFLGVPQLMPRVRTESRAGPATRRVPRGYVWSTLDPGELDAIMRER